MRRVNLAMQVARAMLSAIMLHSMAEHNVLFDVNSQ